MVWGAVAAVDPLHEFRAQIILIAVLAGMHLDSHLARQLNSEALIQLDNSLGRQFLCEKTLALSILKPFSRYFNISSQRYLGLPTLRRPYSIASVGQYDIHAMQ